MSDEKLVLFYCPQMAGLAQRIVDCSHGHIELGSVKWRNYSDGWPDNFIDNEEEQVRGRRTAFLASFDTSDDLFTQFSVMYSFPRYMADAFTLVLPFFPVGTKDRVEKKGDVVTAKTLGRWLDAIPRPRCGTSVVTIYDIHAMQEQLFFGDSILINLQTAMSLLREKIKSIPNVKIVFPDDGSRKRFGREFDDVEHIVCDKRRVGTERRITIKEGDPNGAYCILVDDVILSGETIVACAKEIAAAGASAVSVFVPHAPFPKNSWRRFVTEQLFDHVWITDSCPKVIEKINRVYPNGSKIEVLSLAPLIAHDLLR